MSRNRQLTNRIIAIVLMAIGAVFGGTWNKTGFCLGDHVFSALGLPAWSNGTNGTHYPGNMGMFLIVIGIAVLNSTLQRKTRLWVWIIVILLFLLINFSLIYI
ncbi:MAG: hypothetical protein LIP11_16690 [Clostridiales bacterium]|nr:hypothetical protein [Clostridiales bacterium]